MKNKLFRLAFLGLLLSVITCSAQPLANTAKNASINQVISHSLSFAIKQYKLLGAVMKNKPDSLPQSINKKGVLTCSTSSWWTSGFFPGTLWYLYEASHDPVLKKEAEVMTNRVEKEQYTTSNHDVGFIINCSFGNAYRIIHEKKYEEVVIQAAKSLATRFNPKVGCIESWNANAKWKYPVIIDNMMNLELLMNAFHMTHDSTFYKIAVSHADVTMKNHFRKDYSCYHLVSYNPITGKPEIKQTVQGASDSSAWARGQSWALYGYTMMYRETKLIRYLQQAIHIAHFLITNPNLPKDKIPYWDYNAPNIPHADRDASAGAIMASALIELSHYVNKAHANKYLKIAKEQIRSLSSSAYRSKLGKNGDFILMHSVGAMPFHSEVDVPLTYADYYYIEALLRYKKLNFKN
jgi:hypothetical protein